MGSLPHPTRPLRVIIVDNFPDANGSCLPWPSMSRSHRCPYPGWCLEIINNLVVANNFSVEYIVDRPGAAVDWGHMEENKTFSGLLGRIQRDEADMSCLLYQKSHQRTAYFDFSLAITEINPLFIVREYPMTLTSLLLNFLKPYQDSVWICIFAGFLLQMILWPLISRAEISLGIRKPTERWGDSVWAVVDAWLNGGDPQFTLYSGIILRLIFTTLQTGLFTAIYTAAILFALLAPSDPSPLKSETDAIRLISSGNYKLITDKGLWFHQEMVASFDPFFAALRDATRNNPVVSSSSNEEAMQLVDQGNYSWQVQDDKSSMPFIYKHCFAIVFNRGLSYRSSHFVFAHGNPWKPVIDEALLKSYSMVDMVRRRYFVDRIWDTPECPRSPYAVSLATEPLNLWPIFGVFVLGAVGLGVSAIFLSVEVVIDVIVKSRKRRTN